MKSRLAYAACLIYFLAHFVSAEDAAPGVEATLRTLETQATELLKNNDDAKQAWGAWYIASHRLKNAGPAIRDHLDARLSKANESPEPHWLTAQIDALIQTRTPAKAETLKWLSDKKMHRWVVLLGELDVKSSEPSLRETALSDAYPENTAAANLIANRDATAFSIWALENLVLTLNVVVKDESPTNDSSTGSRTLPRKLEALDGWPPVVSYNLVTDDDFSGEAVAGCVALAPGIQNVSYERLIGSEKSKQKWLPNNKRSPNDYLVKVLRGLGNVATSSEPRTSSYNVTVLKPDNDAQYLEQVTDAADDLRVNFEFLRWALYKRKILPDETARLPKVVSTVEDLRAAKSPLPAFTYDLNAKSAVGKDGKPESLNAKVLRELKAELEKAYAEALEEQKMKEQLKEAYITPLMKRCWLARIYAATPEQHRKRIEEIEALLKNQTIAEDGYFAGVVKKEQAQLKEWKEQEITPQSLMGEFVRQSQIAVDVFERLLRHKKVSLREFDLLR